MFIIHALATFCRGALLFLATLAAVLIIAAVFDQLLPPGFIRWPFAPPYLYRRPRVPFAVPFALKRLQRSFHTVFKRFLSGLIVWRVYLHRLHRFVRLNSLICGKFAVLGEYRGAPPKPKRREAQLRSHRILYFFVPKNFFLENSLSPPSICPLFHAKIPLFLNLCHVCVPKKPSESLNLLKETPF